MVLKQEENPNPDLFTTFERLELCHRVEVTDDNLHIIAKHFGWRVAYDFDPPRLVTGGELKAEVGAWIDQRGSRWKPEPLTQGWSEAGTFQKAEWVTAPDGEQFRAGECQGHATCNVRVHEHGCYADLGNCNDPEEHRRHAATSRARE